MKKTATFQMHVDIWDEEEFIAAARRHAVSKGDVSDEDAATMIGDVDSAAVMLFDPGVSPPGCTIAESECAITGP